jgi:hypothetical protein
VLKQVLQGGMCSETGWSRAGALQAYIGIYADFFIFTGASLVSLEIVLGQVVPAFLLWNHLEDVQRGGLLGDSLLGGLDGHSGHLLHVFFKICSLH